MSGQTIAALRIDSEFRALIPPLTGEERRQLELNILADGCRDPLSVWDGILIDGHNRHEICKANGIAYAVREVTLADRNAAKIWIIRNQFGRRNITLASRCMLAEELATALEPKAKENQVVRKGSQSGAVKSVKIDEVDVRAIAAKEANVSTGTMSAYKFLKENAPEKLEELKLDPNAKIHRVVKDVREAKQREDRQDKRVEAAKSAPELDTRIIVGDFREHADKIADGSVSLIFTDPPYDKEASKMLPALAEFASNKLADGGSLICYVGQTQIPAAMDAFRLHLRYWWTIACVHSGRSTVMREYGINAGWKAVLWFVKGTRDNNSVMVNDVMSGGEEKTHHDWQQSQSEAEYWIKNLCPEDGLVCDPFLGGGTTAAASKAVGRNWIGFEIDESNASIAGARLSK